MKMRSLTYSFSFVFVILVSVLDFPTIFSAPLQSDDNPYSKFIEYLLKHNCTMPKKVKIPFPGSSDESPFAYFLKPLGACQTENALIENGETTLLCKEIFDVIENITCSSGELQSEIDSGPLSANVCSDYKTMKDILPKRDDYLSGRLVDGLLCKVICTSDKHELLCKTLLWSYVTEAKIKNAIENEVKEKDQTVSEVTNEVSSSIKVSLTKIDTESNKENINHTESVKSKSVNNKEGGNSNEQVLDSQKSDEQNNLKSMHLEEENSNRQALDSKESGKIKSLGKSPTESDNSMTPEEKSLASDLKVQEKNYFEMKPLVGADDTAQITSNKIISSTLDNHKEVTSSINNENINVKSSVLAGKESKQITPKDTTEDMPKNYTKDTESKKVSNQDLQSNTVSHQENEISGDKLKTPKPLKSNTQTISTSIASGSSNNNIEKSKDVNDDGLKDNANIDLSTNSKLEQTLPQVSTEMDNELGNVNLQEQENESKVKQTDSKLTTNKDVNEKTKLNDFEVPNDIVDADSKLPESTTSQILEETHEESDPHQEDKEYDDTDNEDYSKSEYGSDNSFNSSPKIQDSISKSSNSAAGSNLSPNNYDSLMNTGNNIGRSSGDIPMIPVFNEQEDGHFFFYFLSIVLILMAGYLIFHNKQKIIALIVEGRHERRRRSGAGYRKLETK